MHKRTAASRKALHVWCAGILQEAMGRGEYWRLVDGQGRPPGLMGMWPSRAVTFIENHDTGASPCCAQCACRAGQCVSLSLLEVCVLTATLAMHHAVWCSER